MKGCMECGKKLGVIEGYRHPTMGKDYLLCSNCFDTVSASVEKYMEFISPYVEFFNKETSTIEDIQKIGENIKKMQNKISNLWTHKSSRNANEILSIIH
jgi:hypothetical protein